MIRLLAERPLLVALMLGVLGVATIYGWLQTGRKPLAIVGLVLLLLIPVVWTISENWITDRERIEQLIFATADAVEANDHEKALAIIGDEATRRQAAGELPQWIFSQADVGNIRSIRILENTSPVQADVDMTVKVEVSSKRGGMTKIRVPRRLLLTFEKRQPGPDALNGGWVVTAYKHMSLIGPDQ